MKRLFIFLLVLFIAPALAAELPNPTGYVNDYANVLSAQEKAQLTSMISQIEKNTSVEIAIVTVDSTQERGGINMYAEELFAKWKIGKKGEDNGLLILVAVKDREARIEVGYGLEGYITDIESSNILNKELFPKFKEGKYGEGLINSVTKIKTILSNENYAPDRPAKKEFSWWIVFIVIGINVLFIFVFFVISIIVLFIFGKLLGGFGGRRSGGGFSSGRSGGGFGGGRSGGGGASGRW